jgi:hypothetical protein
MSEEENEKDDYDFLAGGQGLEHLSMEDTNTPYLKIAQKMSPEAEPGSPSEIPGLVFGQVFNSLTKEIIGVKFNAVVLHWEVTWIEYDDRTFAGRHARHGVKIDTSDYRKWKRVDNGNTIVEYYNFFVLVEGKEEQGPMVLSFKGSGIADAKRLLGDLNMAKLPDGRKASVFAHKWTFATERNENEEGVWWRFGAGKASSIKPLGLIDGKYFAEAVKEPLEIVKNMIVAPQLEASSGSGRAQLPERNDM